MANIIELIRVKVQGLFKKKEEIDYYSLIQAGDVLQVHGEGPNPIDNFIGDGILKFTGGVYSHSAMVMEGGRAGWVTEAEAEGVVRTALKKYFKPAAGQTYKLCIRRLIGITPEIAANAVADAKKRMGWKYDFKSLPLFAMFVGYGNFNNWKDGIEAYRKRFESDPKDRMVVCSEHCGLSFFNVGHPLRDDIVKAKDNSCLSPDGKVSIQRSSKMITIAEFTMKG